MKKALRKTLNLVLPLAMLLSLITLSAFADGDYGESALKTMTVYGYSYKFGSSIWNSDEDLGKIGFQANVAVTNADTVPTGYMGICVKLYNAATGNAVKETDMVYNGIPSRFSFSSDVYYTSGGNYYSRGEGELYNGDGYTPFICSRTPNYSPVTYSSSADMYTVRRNEKGEIYGSELYLNEIGVQPDLILAENADGVVGYVRNEDFNARYVTCPEEAIAYMQNRAPRSIPMYLSDGETVIGTFEIG